MKASRSVVAFTLIELLVACSVLALILVAMLSIIQHTTSTWRASNARIETFQSARIGFETLTRYLSQATLNTYFDYDNPNAPTKYLRKSDLHFSVCQPGIASMPGTANTGQAVFFQAPADKTSLSGKEGLTGLLNACGFYIQYGSNASWLPPHVGEASERFRLMQWIQDTEDLQVYDRSGSSWITVNASDEFPLADNVIALVLWPREEGLTSPNLDSFLYDSRGSVAITQNQLPPVLQVAMVAIDEGSAVRKGDQLQSTIAACLSGLFQNTPSANFDANLDTLGQRLAAQSINFRVFRSAIAMREAKWSP